MHTHCCGLICDRENLTVDLLLRTVDLLKAVVSGPAGPAMAGLVFGNGIKLTSNIKSINFQIYSFCSFVDFEINSAGLEFILSLSSLIMG